MCAQRQTYNKGHTYINPRPCQSLTHAHNHITRAVAAMDSCFALIGFIKVVFVVSKYFVVCLFHTEALIVLLSLPILLQL